MGAIVIPALDGEAVVGRKHRTLVEDQDGKKRFTQDKGSRNIFYNINVLRDPGLSAEPLIITEGEIDCWSAIQAGFPRALSVPNGAPLERVKDEDGKKYRFVDEALDLIPSETKIILAIDADDQGSNLRADLSVRLGAHRCYHVKYPVGCKDLNDALKLHGERGVVLSINRARPMAIEGYYELDELPELAEPRAYSTGILGMDRHWKLRLGDTTVITGIPGHGKSSFINEVCCRMAQIHNWRTVFFSPEQTAQTDHRRALRSFYCERLEVDMLPEEKDKADHWIRQHFGWIIAPEDVDVNLEWFFPTAKSALLRKEAQILVVDPWNEMDHVRPPDMSQTEYVGFAIKSFKKFFRKMNVHGIIAAHPAKLQRQKDGKIPVPGLYDISDSAHWYNKPDAGLVVHREKLTENKTLIRVQKTRYHTIGIPGDLYGAWNIDRSRYTMADEGDLM